MATSSRRSWFLFLDDPVGVLLEVKADQSAGAEIEENGRRIRADIWRSRVVRGRDLYIVYLYIV